MEAEGRLVIQTNGRCRYGRVRVRYLGPCSDNPALPRAEAAPEVIANKGWYSEWVEAAVAGATLGLESAGVAGRCVVTALHDPDHPRVLAADVAVAAVRAAWASVGFVPDDETARGVEKRAAVFSMPSWCFSDSAEKKLA